MTTSFLRPLTLSAVATLLMIAPLAGTATSPATAPGRAVRRPASCRDPAPGHRAAHRGRGRRSPTRSPPSREFLGGNFRVHRPAGAVSRIGFLALGQWSTMGRGVFGLAATEVGPQLQRIDAHGKLVRSQFLTHFGLAISPDHSIVSWLDNRGRPARPGGPGLARVHASARGAG